jgi:WD40 repeat protein
MIKRNLFITSFVLVFVAITTIGCGHSTTTDKAPITADDTPSIPEFIELKGHTAKVTSASFSSDGKRVLTASEDTSVRIWDAETGEELQKFEEHLDVVNSASFSSNGKMVVTTSKDDTVRIWNAETGEELQKLEGITIRNEKFASFSPNGKTVLIAEKFWDVATGKKEELWDVAIKEVPELSMAVASFGCFSPNGKIVFTDFLGARPTLWNSATRKKVQEFEDANRNHVNALRFSPGGKTVLTMGKDCVRIWDAATGKEVQKIETGSLFSASLSPDGKTVLTCNYNHVVALWDIATGKKVRYLEREKLGNFVNFALFSPNGQTVLTCAMYDGEVRIWDWERITRPKSYRLSDH